MEDDNGLESQEMVESKEGIIYSECGLSGKESVMESSDESISSASFSKVLPLRRKWPIFPIAHFLKSPPRARRGGHHQLHPGARRRAFLQAGAFFAIRLSDCRFWFCDTVQNVFDCLVSYRVQIVWNLYLDLFAVLAGNHSGEAMERHRTGDRLRKDHRVGGAEDLRAVGCDKPVGIVVDTGNSDD